MDHSFPTDFFWGVATSAYQIEGATLEAGRGESIWDRFAATPGKIADGTDGSVACDHYHRWRQDLELLRWLGVGAYRFSIAWPRIFPLGTGEANPAGLDFYDALVDGLLGAGIVPHITLNHWDLPQALQDTGGWGSRTTCDAFVTYADAVSRRLGDRVRDWCTHNEPWCISVLGNEEGHHAPGLRDPAEALWVAHHLLLSHGRAVPVLRANSPGARVGIVLNLVPTYAATSRPGDVDEARRLDGFFNRWFLDPVFRGQYPADAIADRAGAGHLDSAALPFVEDGDMATIQTPLDWLGVNYYGRAIARRDPPSEGVPSIAEAPAAQRTDMGFEVYPEGLYDLLFRLRRDYAPARLLITENGAAYGNSPGTDRRISDTARIDFYRGHLGALRRAIAEGVPVEGYFAWSLLDNFEWAHGYQMRFGLVWVDYATQERIPKESAHWYRRVAATNALDDGFEESGRTP